MPPNLFLHVFFLIGLPITNEQCKKTKGRLKKMRPLNPSFSQNICIYILMLQSWRVDFKRINYLCHQIKRWSTSKIHKFLINCRLRVSFTTRNKPKRITQAIPKDVTLCSTSSGSLPYFATSIKINAISPPSIWNMRCLKISLTFNT